MDKDERVMKKFRKGSARWTVSAKYSKAFDADSLMATGAKIELEKARKEEEKALKKSEAAERRRLKEEAKKRREEEKEERKRQRIAYTCISPGCSQLYNPNRAPRKAEKFLWCETCEYACLCPECSNDKEKRDLLTRHEEQCGVL